MKQNLVHTRGTSLILVPCWWDGAADRYARGEMRREEEDERGRKKCKRGGARGEG